MRRFVTSAIAALTLCAVAAPAGAVTRTIAETLRTEVDMGVTFIEDVFNNRRADNLTADAVDNQFNQGNPTNANAALGVPVFGPQDTLLAFGVLASGQDPLLVNFANAFTITLEAAENRGNAPTNGAGFRVSRGGETLLEIENAFGDGDRDVLLFDTRTIADGPISGAFEFRVLGAVNAGVNGALNYDVRFTVVPLPAGFLLLLGALGLGGLVCRGRNFTWRRVA
ncbi:MAG: hypothetical protein AAGC81_12655 [Pseudomonadota bacterium]